MTQNVILIIRSFAMIIFLNNYASATIDHETYYSNKCLSQFSHYEKIHNIPMNLLKAVSLAESGKRHESSKKIAPWPWTVNFQGKGYYYKNKKEAILAVSNLRKKGYKSIDIGCMQINLYYHPNAFNDLEDAFEPIKNIAYAASFLKSNFNKYQDWHQAVASYHSDNKSLGWPYARKVVSIWRDIVDDSKFNVKNNKQLLSNHQKFLAKKKSASNDISALSHRKRSDIFVKIYKSNYSPSHYKMIESIANKAVERYGTKN